MGRDNENDKLQPLLVRVQSVSLGVQVLRVQIVKDN